MPEMAHGNFTSYAVTWSLQATPDEDSLFHIYIIILHFYLHICKICRTFAAKFTAIARLSIDNMKKFFSLALVACMATLAMTSCNKDKNVPFET